MKKILLALLITLSTQAFGLYSFQSSTTIPSFEFGENIDELIEAADEANGLDLSGSFPLEQSLITADWFNLVIDVVQEVDGTNPIPYHVQQGQDIVETTFNNVFNLINDKIAESGAVPAVDCWDIDPMADEQACIDEPTCFVSDDMMSCETRPNTCDGSPDEMSCMITGLDGLSCDYVGASVCQVSSMSCGGFSFLPAPFNSESYCNNALDPAENDSNMYCAYYSGSCQTFPIVCEDAISESMCNNVQEGCAWDSTTCIYPGGREDPEPAPF